MAGDDALKEQIAGIAKLVGHACVHRICIICNIRSHFVTCCLSCSRNPNPTARLKTRTETPTSHLQLLSRCAEAHRRTSNEAMKGLEFMAVKAAKCVSIVTFGCALVARPKSRERFGVNIVGVSLSFASRNKIGHQHWKEH